MPLRYSCSPPISYLTPMVYGTSMDTHPDDSGPRPSVVRVSAPEMNANAGMQVALTVLALAALPISAWLYISTYVEDRVEEGIERQYQIIQSDMRRQNDKLEDMQGYMTQLCTKVRSMDPQFSCLSQNEIRYRYPYDR